MHEAIDFIKNDIESELEKIFTVLNDEMEKTLIESKALQAQQRVAIKNKEEKSNEIRRNVMLRKIFAMVKFFSSGYELVKR